MLPLLLLFLLVTTVGANYVTPPANTALDSGGRRATQIAQITRIPDAIAAKPVGTAGLMKAIPSPKRSSSRKVSARKKGKKKLRKSKTQRKPKGHRTPEVSSRLPAYVEGCFLGGLFLALGMLKWLRLTKYLEEHWDTVNHHEERKGREHYKRFIESSDEHTREARLNGLSTVLTSVGTIVSTAVFFMVKPSDIATDHGPTPYNIYIFFVISFVGMMFYVCVDNVALHEFASHFMNPIWFGKYRAGMNKVFRILEGNKKTNPFVRYLILTPIDVAWMYSVQIATFPLFCSYRAALPYVIRRPEMTCWDNWQHWALVCLSVCSMAGIFSWQLSIVLRKANFPQRGRGVALEGYYSNYAGASLCIECNASDNRFVNLNYRSRNTRPRNQLYEILPPYGNDVFRMRQCKDTLRNDGELLNWPKNFHFKRGHNGASGVGGNNQEDGSSSSGISTIGGSSAMTRNDRNELRVDGRDGGVLGGTWVQIGLLRIPYFEEPIPAFCMVILRVACALLWSALGHRANLYHPWIVLGFALCSLLSAMIAGYWCQPCALMYVNRVTCCSMICSGLVTLVSCMSIHGLDKQRVQSMTLLVIIIVALAVFGILTQIATSLLQRSSGRLASIGSVVWRVHAGKRPYIKEFTVNQWRTYHKEMKEQYGSHKPITDVLIDSRSWRILSVEIEGRSEIRFDKWIENEDNRRDVVPLLVNKSSSSTLNSSTPSRLDSQAISGETHCTFRLVRMYHILPSFLNSGMYYRPEGKEHKIERISTDQPFLDEEATRVLTVGISGSGKSTLLTALCGLAHLNHTFLVKEESQSYGVTKCTSGVLSQEGDERRVYIDTPGSQDAGRDAEYISESKEALSKFIFINTVLLVVRATETRFSKLYPALEILFQHFGKSITKMLTVVFTDAARVQEPDHQSRIIDEFEKIFQRIFPGRIGESEKQKRYIFIDTHAVLPDRISEFTPDACIAAECALERIKERIDESKQRRFNTCIWPPVIRGFDGALPSYIESEPIEVKSLEPLWVYKGLKDPPQLAKTAWRLEPKPSESGIEINKDSGKLSLADGKTFKAYGRVRINVVAEVKKEGILSNSSIEWVERNSECSVQLNVLMSKETLAAQLKERLDKYYVSQNLSKLKRTDVEKALLGWSEEAKKQILECISGLDEDAVIRVAGYIFKSIKDGLESTRDKRTIKEHVRLETELKGIAGQFVTKREILAVFDERVEIRNAILAFQEHPTENISKDGLEGHINIVAEKVVGKLKEECAEANRIMKVMQDSKKAMMALYELEKKDAEKKHTAEMRRLATEHETCTNILNTQIRQLSQENDGLAIKLHEERRRASDLQVDIKDLNAQAMQLSQDKCDVTKRLSELSQAVMGLEQRDLTKKVSELSQAVMRLEQEKQERSPLYGKTFVQRFGVGVASYHFVSERTCFISYENAPSDWKLSDDSRPPPRKAFKDIKFDLTNRIFQGTISWAPLTFGRSAKWEYTMEFDSTFTTISGGFVLTHPSQKKDYFGRDLIYNSHEVFYGVFKVLSEDGGTGQGTWTINAHAIIYDDPSVPPSTVSDRQQSAEMLAFRLTIGDAPRNRGFRTCKITLRPAIDGNLDAEQIEDHQAMKFRLIKQ